MKLVLPLVLVVLSSGCAGACEDEIIEVKPHRSHRAILFQRNCGATTGVNRQVSILPDDEQLTGTGNVFIADADQGAAFGKDPIVQLFWQADGRLTVLHHPLVRIFKRQGTANGVRITYEQQPL